MLIHKVLLLLDECCQDWGLGHIFFLLVSWPLSNLRMSNLYKKIWWWLLLISRIFKWVWNTLSAEMKAQINRLEKDLSRATITLWMSELSNFHTTTRKLPSANSSRSEVSDYHCVTVLQSQGHLRGEQVAWHLASQYHSSAFTYSYSPGRQSFTLQSDFHTPHSFHKLKSPRQEGNKKTWKKEEIEKMEHLYLTICYSLWLLCSHQNITEVWQLPSFAFWYRQVIPEAEGIRLGLEWRANVTLNLLCHKMIVILF